MCASCVSVLTVVDGPRLVEDIHIQDYAMGMITKDKNISGGYHLPSALNKELSSGRLRSSAKLSWVDGQMDHCVCMDVESTTIVK
jgi:hypothetical protein